MDISKRYERRTFRKRDNSVMFAAHCQDGRTAYFVVPGHGTPERDFQALPLARDRQAKGELP